MQRNGITQDITVLPVNSQPIMVVQIGSGDNIVLIRWGIDTIIEYYVDTTGLWNEAKVLSPSSVKDEKTQEVVNLQANTPVRLKETPTTSGLLVLSTKMYDIEYNAEDLQTTYQFLYGSGIVKDKLYGNIIASGGRQITVSSAQFVIDGFVGFFKSPQSVIVDIGDGSVRKDLLILRKVQAEGDVYLCIKRGIPSPNPEPPKLTQNTNGIYEIALAEISVQANSQTISQGDIKDVRPTGFLSIIDMIYPVGSIYISLDKNFDPNNTWQGTTWEKIKSGIFLEATTDANQVEKEIAPAIPNIKAKSCTWGVIYQKEGSWGAFKTYNEGTPASVSRGNLGNSNVLEFSANYNTVGSVGQLIDNSRAAKIYKDDCDTVQPNSIRCFIWKRIK